MCGKAAPPRDFQIHHTKINTGGPAGSQKMNQQIELTLEVSLKAYPSDSVYPYKHRWHIGGLSRSHLYFIYGPSTYIIYLPSKHIIYLPSIYIIYKPT